MTPLCELAFKYGTDKCPQIKHSYTPYYYELLKDRRESIKKVMELGIGFHPNLATDDRVYDRGLKRMYHKGASLKMWRDFFPNAQVYGVDRQPGIMFEDKRIETFLGDERSTEDWERILAQTGTDIDLFIDDGSHRESHQVSTCKFLMPKLDQGVIYIIEDVKTEANLSVALPEYNCFEPTLALSGNAWAGRLIQVAHKT